MYMLRNMAQATRQAQANLHELQARAGPHSASNSYEAHQIQPLDKTCTNTHTRGGLAAAASALHPQAASSSSSAVVGASHAAAATSIPAQHAPELAHACSRC